MFCTVLFCCGDFLSLKGKYISGAMLLLVSGMIVKVIGAIYKIPLTSYIGTVGRGYYAFAYNLVMPLHAVTMGAFPIALSKLVSKYKAKGDLSAVYSLKKDSVKLFFAVGLVGMCVLLLCAKPYCSLVVKSPGSLYAAFAVAPSLLFSCLGGAYRGYYEGCINMLPTAVSQIIEALGKLVFGIVFSRLAFQRLCAEFDSFQTVMGRSVNQNDMLSAVYPYSTAAAMLGVTVASFVSFGFLLIYSKADNQKVVCSSRKNTQGMLLSFAFPIMLSSCVQSVFQFLDSTAVQYALNCVRPEVLRSFYSSALSTVNVSDGELSAYAYGVLSASLDFKNLVPGVTMALGVCAVPVLSSAYEKSDRLRFYSAFNLILKYTMLISCLGSLVIFVCADDALALLYGTDSRDIVIAAAPPVRAFALCACAFSLSGLFVFCVQSIGLAKKSVPSYVACGIIRVVLNIVLIENDSLLLFGSVISSFVGYSILAIWNFCIFVKRTKVKTDYVKSLVLPLVTEVAVLMLFSYVFPHYNLSNYAAVNLVSKTCFVTLLYLLPCFLCGMLNFRDFFRYLGYKKCR